MRTVLRHQLSRKPFVTVANEVARDDRLSYGARGVLIAMLSRPTNWEFSADRLAAGSPSDGRRPVMRYLRELEANGYVFRYREKVVGSKTRGGTLVRTVTVVSDEPIDDWEATLATVSRMTSDDTDIYGSTESVPPYGSTDSGTPGSGTAGSGTPKERQRTKPRNKTQTADHSSIHSPIPNNSSGRDQRNPDSESEIRVDSARQSGATSSRADDSNDEEVSTGAADDVELANGWIDQNQRRPWADLDRRWQNGDISDEDVAAVIEAQVGGFDAAEESTVIGMLEDGAKPVVVFNKILKDRR